ncbi:MAG: hypothetical protein ABSG86_14415 [Thermoguttaceae bacterium]|jgi:hypothetical protein
MKTAGSRRHFLRRSTGIVASSILTGGLSIARAAHAAGTDQITGKNAWTCEGPVVSGHAQEHVDLMAAIRKGGKYTRAGAAPRAA